MTPTAELGAKLHRVRAWLDERGADAVLVAAPANVAWLACGGEIGRIDAPVAFVVTHERCALLAPVEDVDRLRQEETRGLPIDTVALALHGRAALVDRARDLAPSSARWVADGSGFDFAVETGFAALRSTLLPIECERLRRLGKEAAVAVEAVASECYPGILESDAAARLAAEFHRRHLTPVQMLAGADDRFETYARPMSKDAVAEKTLMLSLGARRWGLHVALSRTICLARPSSALLEKYETLAAGAVRLRAAARPGTTLGAAVAKAGIEDLSLSQTVGAVTGYSVCEAEAHALSTWPLAAGQAIRWCLALPGGRCQDTVLLENIGSQLLTMTENWPRRTTTIDRVPYEVPDLLLML